MPSVARPASFANARRENFSSTGIPSCVFAAQLLPELAFVADDHKSARKRLAEQYDRRKLMGSFGASTYVPLSGQITGRLDLDAELGLTWTVALGRGPRSSASGELAATH